MKPRRRNSFGLLVNPILFAFRRCFFAGLPLIVLLSAPAAQAAQFTVTSLADSGPGSLRQIMQASSAGDTILFGVRGTIVLSSSLTIDKNLTIRGPGASQIAISGIPGYPYMVPATVFAISHAVSAAISGVTIEKGGISNAGTLTLTQTSVSDTVANVRSMYFGIINDGTLTLNDSTVSGHISNDYGGGIENRGMLTLNHSTISGNFGYNDGWGIVNYEGTLIMSDSTVTGNFSGGSPPGLRIWQLRL